MRQGIKSNEAAWKSADKALTAKIKADCPDTGWDKATYEECAAKVKDAKASEMEAFATKDQELRDQMAAVDPDHCTLYSGDLVTK